MLSLSLWGSAVFSFLAFLIILFEKRKKIKTEKLNEQDLEITEQKIEFAG